MKTHIALFRGINVGGRNTIPMAKLRDLLEGLGLEKVQTYIQSGNAVFRCPATHARSLAEEIQNTIEAEVGFTPDVQVLSTEFLRSTVEANPFPEAESAPTSLHLFFLKAVPEQPDLKGLEDLKASHERYELIAQCFYLHAPDGIGKSKLAARAERLLGVSATARNWKTVKQILEMASG